MNNVQKDFYANYVVYANEIDDDGYVISSYPIAIFLNEDNAKDFARDFGEFAFVVELQSSCITVPDWK